MVPVCGAPGGPGLPGGANPVVDGPGGTEDFGACRCLAWPEIVKK